jgi:hypothetical protein
MDVMAFWHRSMTRRPNHPMKPSTPTLEIEAAEIESLPAELLNGPADNDWVSHRHLLSTGKSSV